MQTQLVDGLSLVSLQVVRLLNYSGFNETSFNNLSASYSGLET